jgi:hypothetical protein
LKAAQRIATAADVVSASDGASRRAAIKRLNAETGNQYSVIRIARALLSSAAAEAEMREALEVTDDRLAPVQWADGGKAIMGPDGDYWPYPLTEQAQQKWAAWCQKARATLAKEPS